MLRRRLEQLKGPRGLTAELRLDDDAPVWVAVAALDLGARVGMTVWSFPPRVR
jgi:hypothetical protein